MYDISIIGAGVVGGAIARELSKYDLNIALIEKEGDVSLGASKANSGIVHGGYVSKYGTLKGKLCIKGNSMFDQLNKELNFGFRRTGAIVIGFDREDEERIKKIYENALKVGHKEDDIEIIYKDKIKEIEPHINDDVKVAFYCKSVGVTSPYEMTIALVENAIENGVELKLKTEVLDIDRVEEGFNIRTNNGSIKTKYIINAAGVYSDKIAGMVGINSFKILPRKGQYILFGKDQGDLVNTVVFQTPTNKGKGILVTTTYHGNFMIGPDAEDIEQKWDVDTTIESLKHVVDKSRKSIPGFNIKRALTTFSGIRARSNIEDFVIEESDIDGFINVAGIDSPGLTSSPAIALEIVDILTKMGANLKKNKKFNPYRNPIIIDKENFDGRIDDENPEKNIICRCEKVTEYEIIDAINRNIPIESVDAVKRRTRAGMGICQGNFCRPRVKKLISREKDIPIDKIRIRDESSNFTPQKININEIRGIDK
ncbi:NAD(P)/FAD-dependent oxidoreductase [Clostridium sp. D2Q-14]|uniref:NAD(P)/FAD-dependent oxidoreductase n=1 Tax=Anaeromonas gelatinilytica TaxID=2683194 RepID=UPI00193BEEBE|nr:NAD(P)/FAD-dependent oxidoreductase [Anaeromonas gelatinilytica]MBS4535110.1 NAD(P)/FAD-dependent oxidoreductase [Anaeromonas gelatinilytica]